MPLYKRGEIWWINLRHGGRRIRRTTRTADKREARRQHDELAARLWKLKATGKQLSDALVLWHKARPRAASATRLLKQIRDSYPDRPLSKVTEESIAEVFGEKSPGNYNRIAGVFRAALNLAHARGWIDAAPRIARRKEPVQEPRYLTAEQWKDLRKELPPHLKPMASFAIATGLRWSNVAGLTWDRVSLERRQAWIPAGSAKGRRTIAVPLSEDALAALQGVRGKREGFVFTYRGKPLGSPKTALRKATARAGVKATWHTFRHTWASWHAMNGTPLDALQKLGAWETRSVVDRYKHLTPSYVAGFADNAKPVTGKVVTKSVTALPKSKRAS